MATLISRKYLAAVAVHLWQLHKIHRDVDLLKRSNLLPEQLEAIIGAVLVDSEFDFDKLRFTLQPWITAASNITLMIEATRQHKQSSSIFQRLLEALVQQLQNDSNQAKSTRTEISAKTRTKHPQWASLVQPVDNIQQEQQQLSALIGDCLSANCNYQICSQDIINQCSILLWHTLAASHANVNQQAKIWSSFGHHLQHFAAKQHSWQKCFGSNSSTYSSVIKQGGKGVAAAATASQAEQLIRIQHRCVMQLQPAVLRSNLNVVMKVGTEKKRH